MVAVWERCRDCNQPIKCFRNWTIKINMLHWDKNTSSGTTANVPSLSFFERCQASDVVPEIGGLAFGFSQHDDLLLGQGCGKRGVLLTQQEVIVGPGHSCGEEDINKGSGPERFRSLENGTHMYTWV